MSNKSVFSRPGYSMSHAESNRGKAMIHKLRRLIMFASVLVLATGSPAQAQPIAELVDEPDHIRGEIAAVDDSSITVTTSDGASVHIVLADITTILSLTKASFTDVDFGVYVGSVSKRLDEYSPIVRDSMSYLHEGYELRIFDEELRGLALGHTSWDLAPESVISHGWVDDLEVRVLSIKYGSTEEEETDVRVERDKPVLYLKIGDRNLLKPGAHIFAGAQKDDNGGFEAEYVMVGDKDVVPPI